MALPSLPIRDTGTPLALDARNLASLKQQAKAAPGESLRAVAGQFEALFMQMLLKSMREALPQDGPFASETTKTYTAMFDQQMAQQLAKKGVGIADLLVRQLTPSTAGGTAAAAGEARASAAGAGEGAGAAFAGTLQSRIASRTGTATSAPASTATPATAASLPERARDFLERMRPHAEAAAQAAGIPVTFLLAQAALETGWGRHQPRAVDGATSHNLFGIKAGSSWKGASTVAATTEFVAGRAATTQESFRSYGSYGEAFRDFTRLIRGSPRYAGVMAATGDGNAYARELQQAGYATDPRYAEKLGRMIQVVGRHLAGPPAQVAALPADKRSGAA